MIEVDDDSDEKDYDDDDDVLYNKCVNNDTEIDVQMLSFVLNKNNNDNNRYIDR